jgi:hypothetical protein
VETNHVLVVGPGSKAIAQDKPAIDAFQLEGGRLLALGLAQGQADEALSCDVSIQPAEHINAYFDSLGVKSPFVGIGPADTHNRSPRTIPLVSKGAGILGNGTLALAPGTNLVFCQLVPWQFKVEGNVGIKKTFRRTGFLVTRLLANLGARSETPLLTRLSTPLGHNESGRWLQGYYLDEPQEWDDPYRFFRW